MSYIDSINQAATASTAGANSANPAQENDAVLGKQDFLQLLVAQLQNQDPLNPDDPTEFTAQLAQFSSLEQLFNLNESMDSMATSFESSDRMAALETIGKEVVYFDSSFNFSGGAMEVGYQLDGYAEEVTVLIQKDGATIRSFTEQSMTEGNHFIQWDGLTQTGAVAPIGDYKIVLQANAGAGESVAIAPLIKSEVTGVDLSSGNGGTLITEAGETNFSTIIGVYDKNAQAGSSVADETADEDESSEESVVDEVVDDVVAAATEATQDAIL